MTNKDTITNPSAATSAAFDDNDDDSVLDDEYHVAYRDPTPPPPGTRLVWRWWCPPCGLWRDMRAGNRCLHCGGRFDRDRCRTVWFTMDAQGRRRSRPVRNQRFQKEVEEEEGEIEIMMLLDVMQAEELARAEEEEERKGEGEEWV